MTSTKAKQIAFISSIIIPIVFSKAQFQPRFSLEMITDDRPSPLTVQKIFFFRSPINMFDDLEQVNRHFAKSGAMSDGPMFFREPSFNSPSPGR